MGCKASSRANEDFDLVDFDNSGTISQAEYEAAYGKARTEAEFDEADTTKDGTLSRQEYVAAYSDLEHHGQSIAAEELASRTGRALLEGATSAQKHRLVHPGDVYGVSIQEAAAKSDPKGEVKFTDCAAVISLIALTALH